MLLIITGKVIKPHGLHGWVKVIPLSENPERFRAGNSFILEGLGRRLVIEEARSGRGCLLVKFLGVDRREEAEVLHGRELWITDEEMGPPPPGCLWEHQLLGLRVCTLEGRELGEVVEIFPTGSNDVLVVRGEREYLIPFTHEVVKEIEPERGSITIAPLPGLLEE